MPTAPAQVVANDRWGIEVAQPGQIFPAYDPTPPEPLRRKPVGWRERFFLAILRRWFHAELTRFGGLYEFEFYEDGSVPWDSFRGRWRFDLGRLRAKARITNLIPTAALTDVLNVYLVGGTAKTLWYAGLVDNSGFSAFSASDTSAAHAGWAEWGTYSETTRQQWTPAAVAAGSVTNTSAMVVTPTAGATLRGGFLISNNVKSGTTGLLYSEGPFDAGNQTVVNGTPFRVNATFTATSAT